MRILVAAPTARLLMRYKEMDGAAMSALIEAACARHGVDGDRIETRGKGSRTEILETYNEIDICLDTFPYSGGLTVLEALYMGTPTLTFPGATYASRHSASHLEAAGFPELVMDCVEAYTEEAIDMANKPDRLKAYGPAMREKFLNSPFFDYGGFTDHLLTEFADLRKKQL